MSSRQLVFLGFVAVATFAFALLTGPMVVDLLVGSEESAATETPDEPGATDASPESPHPSTAP